MSAASRNYQGPAFLSGGFRPFFLLGAFYSGLSILLWLPQLYGRLELSSALAPVDWHIHELYFGFLPAIITGFLFTAVPNWTGRMPIRGMPLLLLLVVWIIGRIAVCFSAGLDWRLVMIVDVGFLALIAVVIGNEIVAGKNWRNFKVLIPVTFLVAANIAFHTEVQYSGTSDLSRRAAAGAILLLIMLIGGRVIPSFTRNWLVRENPGKLPVPFSRYDVFTIAVSVIAMSVWIVTPSAHLTGGLMAIACVLQCIRLWRWAGYRTFGDSLVLIMHVSYLFVPLGFGLIAASTLWPDQVPQIAGIHALSVGAVGTITLSIMVRATLGHTGRTLRASAFAKVIFVCVIAAALARIFAGLDIGPTDTLLYVAALGWAIAFIGFGAAFAPALTMPRRGKT